MTTNATTILTHDNQSAFKRYFKSLYGVAPFYFDYDTVVDETTDTDLEQVAFGADTFGEVAHRIAEDLQLC